MDKDIQLNTQQAIDQRAAQLTTAIQDTVREHIPLAKPSQFAKGYWTEACTQAVREARKARREWTDQGTEDSWVKYN